MEKNVWLYFNNEADDDNITSSSNCMFPAKALKGMTPTSDTILFLTFDSMRNVTSSTTDSVGLTLSANNVHLDVMKTILRNLNNTRPNFNGFVNVADDLTTIVGGSADAKLSKYITDSNNQEAGSISNVASMSIKTASNGAITATADGTGTGTVPQGGFYTVSSTDNAHIVILPAAVAGTVVYLNSEGEASEAYELRSSSPAAIAINGGTGSNAESAIAAGTALVRCVCVANDKWICTQYANDGTESKVEAAA
tara:strand:+ start:191 stop:949 length:759 start_codon:yes stop_codon:yes gene_type:complete